MREDVKVSLHRENAMGIIVTAANRSGCPVERLGKAARDLVSETTDRYYVDRDRQGCHRRLVQIGFTREEADDHLRLADAITSC